MLTVAKVCSADTLYDRGAVIIHLVTPKLVFEPLEGEAVPGTDNLNGVAICFVPTVHFLPLELLKVVEMS